SARGAAATAYNVNGVVLLVPPPVVTETFRICDGDPPMMVKSAFMVKASGTDTTDPEIADPVMFTPVAVPATRLAPVIVTGYTATAASLDSGLTPRTTGGVPAMLKLVLSADVRPADCAVNENPVPVRSIESVLNEATPPTALRKLVPDKIAPDVPVNGVM